MELTSQAQVSRDTDEEKGRAGQSRAEQGRMVLRKPSFIFFKRVI